MNLPYTMAFFSTATLWLILFAWLGEELVEERITPTNFLLGAMGFALVGMVMIRGAQ